MTILATVVLLGVLIFVHELGHFLAAKSVGIDVQRFSIGLPPTMVGFRRGETDYVIGWIPLGGYVKMGGMDDEVMERIEGGSESVDEAVNPDEPRQPRQPRPGDFDGKPIWARTWVISAGVIMNMLFAFAVYTGINAVSGIQEVPDTRVGQVLAGLLPPGTEALAELPVGSRLITIGDRQVDDWRDVQNRIMEASSGPLTFVTADPPGEFEIDAPSDLEVRAQIFSGLSYWRAAEVGAVSPGTPAESAGLEPGDRILMADGIPISNWDDLVDVIEARSDTRIELSLERDGRPLSRFVTPEATQREDLVTGETRTVGVVGIFPPILERRNVSLIQAVQLGYAETVSITRMIVGFLGDLFTGGVSPRSVGSILTIGVASGQAAAMGLENFLSFMALFSVNLAVLNLLPIPVLDGGHLVFLGIEALRGKALSLEQRMKWSHAGFLVLIGIMVWALSNDILRLFGI